MNNVKFESSQEQIINVLNQFYEQGIDIITTQHKGGLYDIYDLVDQSRYMAWRTAILVYIKHIGLDAPDIIKCIEDQTKHLLSSVTIILEQIQSLKNLVSKGLLCDCSSNTVVMESELENLFIKFHRVARQLRSRHANRPTLTINDEYDVQDLLHALLLIHFNDVRAEEWTPSYAGGAVRVDFLLKDCKTFVEVKKTRPSMTAKDLGVQLLIDREKYKAHPDCEKLYCFVYDPEGHLGNPTGIKRDLEKGQEDFLKVFIMPE